MPSAKTHPHIDHPSEAPLKALVKTKAPAIRQLYLDASFNPKATKFTKH
jgi:hypothetical protein